MSWRERDSSIHHITCHTGAQKPEFVCFTCDRIRGYAPANVGILVVVVKHSVAQDEETRAYNGRSATRPVPDSLAGHNALLGLIAWALHVAHVSVVHPDPSRPVLDLDSRREGYVS